MTKTEIEQFRQKLLDLRSGLQELAGACGEEPEPLQPDEAGMGRLSRMDAMQAQKAAEEGPRRRKRQIQKIDGALRRIDLGEYGSCFVCEEELDLLRLAADPTITRCEDCIEPS